MKQFLALCVFCLLFPQGCSSSSTKKAELDEKKSEIYLSAGTEALYSGDYTSALSALLNAVKLTPKSPEAWNNLGLAYAGKENFEQAEECWKKAIAIDPSHGDARLNLGSLYIRQRRFAEAERNLKLVLKDLTYANAHQAHYNLALNYLAQKRNLLAEQELKLAVKASEAFCPAWLKLGHLQRDRGEFSEAAASMKKAVSGTCYHNPQAHYELGTVYLKNKDSAQAKSKFLEIIRLFPQSEWAKKAEISLNMIR